MILKAERGDIPALKKNWLEVFKDPEQFVDAFFEKAFDNALCLKYAKGGRIVSSVFSLPAYFKEGEKESRCSYLYAAMTLERYRGRGYMSALIKEAERAEAKRGGILTALRPADKSAESYYRHLGYEYFGYTFSGGFSKAELEELAGGKTAVVAYGLLSEEEYKRLYRGGTCFTQAYNVFCLEEGVFARFEGGHLLAREENGRVDVKELYCQKEGIAGAAAALISCFPKAEHFEIKSSISLGKSSVSRSRLMAKTTEKAYGFTPQKAPYISVLLD